MCRQPVTTTNNVTQWPLRGTCDRFTGICTCHADPILGFWYGATCSTCLPGYIGSGCRLQSIVMSQFSPIEYEGKILSFTDPAAAAGGGGGGGASSPAAAPDHRREISQPRLWLPHILRTRIGATSYVILSGTGLVIFDEAEVGGGSGGAGNNNNNNNGGSSSITVPPPITFDVSETFSSAESGTATRVFCSSTFTSTWISTLNNRFYFGVAPSSCAPDKLKLFSTIELGQLKFRVNPPRPGSVKAVTRYEGWMGLNSSRELLKSTDHAAFVYDWVQFCAVFFTWFRYAPDINTPWNLRCVPVPHRDPTSPLDAEPSVPGRIVANTLLSPKLQTLGGIIYWPKLDGILIFGSTMPLSEMNTKMSAQQQQQQQSTTAASSSPSAGGSCFLSILWRNLSLVEFELPGPKNLRQGCVMLERAQLLIGGHILLAGRWKNANGAVTLNVNDTHKFPSYVSSAETAVPAEYSTVATAFGPRGVVVAAHCSSEAFQKWKAAGATTADSNNQQNGGGGNNNNDNNNPTTTLPPPLPPGATTTAAPGSPPSGPTNNPSPSSPSAAPSENNNNNQNVFSSEYSSRCLISRFNFNTETFLKLVVTQVASDKELPLTAMAISMDDNAIYTVLSRAPQGMTVRRYLGWAIQSSVPSLAEVSGGTPITVHGTGFADTSSKGDLVCAFQPQASSESATFLLQNNITETVPGLRVVTFVGAQYVNDRAVICPAAPVIATSGCSNVDVVDVTIVAKQFTGYGTPIFRFQQPKILSTNPRSTFANGLATLPITVVGTGFSPSNVMRCKFSSNNSGDIETKGEFLTSSSVLCASPNRIVPLSPDARVDVAVDGFLYTLAPVGFTLFGQPSGILFKNKFVRVTDSAAGGNNQQQSGGGGGGGASPSGGSSSSSSLGDVEVISVDAAGNPTSEGLGLLPVIIMTVPKLCAPLGPDPCTQQDVINIIDNTSAQETRLKGNTGGAMVDGTALFTSLALSSKKATGFNGTVPNYVLLVAYIPTRKWFATTQLFIDTGVPVALVIIIPPARHVSDQGDMAATPSVGIVDAGGNPVVRGVETWEAQAEIVEEPAPEGVTLVSVDVIQTNRARFALFSNGVAEFLQIPVHARHGLTYRIKFSVRRNPNVRSVTSQGITSFCPGGSFKLAGLYTCTKCLAHSTCDGDNVSTDPGYWRASVLSTTVIECPTKVACPGGPKPGVCAPNYQGPRCDLCEPGFGRGVTGTCDTCPHTGVSGFMMLLIVVGLTTILTLFTVYSIQNSSRMMPRIVVLQQLVTHVQTLAILTSLDMPWPQYLMKTAQWIDAVADFRVMDTSFGECLISAYGLDFTGKFFFQLVLLGEIFLCIATTKAVLFIRPNFLKAEEDEDKSSRFAKAGLKRVPLKITTMRIIVPSVLCGLFFLHQGTLMYSFGVLDCFNVDLGNGQKESVLLVDPSISCDSTTYKGIVYIAYPIIILLGIFVPIGLVVTYEAHRFFKPDERNLRYQLGAFLVCGVTNSSWYWQVIIFVRKGLMVLVVTLLKWPFDVFTLQLLFVLYLVLLQYIRPYLDAHFLIIDKFGCIINLLVINVATFYHTTKFENLHAAIAPIVMVLELIATIAFLLLISHRWRKWVFVHLRIEKRDLHEETDDSVLQLHEIIRDIDREVYGAEGQVPTELLEQIANRKRGAGGVVIHNTDKDGSGRSKTVFRPNFGDEADLREMMMRRDDAGDGQDDGQDDGQEMVDLRRVDQLPDKIETFEEQEQRMAKVRGLQERLLRERLLSSNLNAKGEKKSLSKRNPFLSSKNATPASVKGKDDPRDRHAHQLYYHHPAVVSPRDNNGNEDNNDDVDDEEEESSGHHYYRRNNNNNNKNQQQQQAQNDDDDDDNNTPKVLEYVPRAVPLPDSDNKLIGKKEILRSRLLDYQRAEIERTAQENAKLLEEQAAARGPKVVRAAPTSASELADAKRFTLGFDEYRANKKQQQQQNKNNSSSSGRSSPTRRSSSANAKDAAAWRLRDGPLEKRDA